MSPCTHCRASVNISTPCDLFSKQTSVQGDVVDGPADVVHPYLVSEL